MRRRLEGLTDTEGAPAGLIALPGLSEAEIDGLAAELGFPVPAELRALLRECSGIEGALDAVDFTGRSLDFGQEVFPRPIPIAHDGFGNFWVLDVTASETEVAPVFFACHDPPVILLQAPSLAGFLDELIRMSTPPHASAIDDVHEDRLYDVWAKNPGTLTWAQAGEGDAALRAFAATLDERFTIVDLRNAPVGMGFSWGRHGAASEVRRHGDERIFAYAAPPSRSIWARITGWVF